jgi:signal transduction histidine kinase
VLREKRVIVGERTPRTLSSRLIGVMAGFALAAAMTIILSADFRERAALVELETNEGRLFAAALVHATAGVLADETNHTVRLNRLLEHVAREPAVRSIAVLHPDGSVRAGPPGSKPVSIDPQMVARAMQSPGGVVDTDIRHRALRFVVRIPSLKDHAQPQALLFFELDITRALAALGHQMWSSALYAVLLVIVLAFVLYALLRRAVVRPATQLANQAARLGDGDLSVRSGLTAQQAGSQEFHRLAAAFDTMAARMQESEAALEQRVRERTRELEIAVAELESFSYAVSHDLRAPLRSIDGFALMLADRLGRSLDQESRDYLDRVRQQAQFMGSLIDNLLTLAHVSRMELARGRVDLTSLFRDCIANLRRTDPARQVEIAVQPSMEADADPEALRIALAHLLDNAWKFTRDARAPRIDVGIDRKLDRQVVFVRDNGVGFDPAYVERLFTPFRRLHSPRDFTGTGIGLAIVQRVIQRHGGQIWAEGSPGGGAIFFFTLAGHGN